MRGLLAIGILWTCGLSPALAADAASAEDVAKAVAAMRKVDRRGMNSKQLEAKALELQQAWKTLTTAGSPGAVAVKNELQKVVQAKEKDDFFLLGAGAVLWRIGKLDEASAIATAWSGDVNLSANYNYVFFTAFEAARTRDPRVLPMLTAVLRDREGEVFIAQHSLAVGWPLSHRFLWGAFGPRGLPALVRVLDESKDPTPIASAIRLLAQSQCVEALPKIRELARGGTGMVRTEAIRALGQFGHPEDFDFLAAGLKNEERELAWSFAFALFEYGDLRAVPQLVPQLSRKDDDLAFQVVACLRHLVTPEGIDALQKCGETAADLGRRETCQRAAADLLKSLKLTYGEFAAKPAAEKAALTATLRERKEEIYRLRRDDQKLTHDELLKVAAKWKADGRTGGAPYAWAEDRHILAAATSADLPLLLDVAAACYSRLSGECLGDVRRLERLVQRLGRTRYRSDAGVCEKVLPLPKPAGTK